MNASLPDRLHSRAVAVLDEWQRRYPELTSKCDVDAAGQAALQVDPFSHYQSQPAALSQARESVAGMGDSTLAAAFDQMLLCWLIKRSTSDGQGGLPPRLAAEVDSHHERMLARAEAGLDSPPTLSRDLFAKDLAICTGRMLPARFAVMQPKMRLPLTLAKLGGPRQFLDFCGLYYGRFGGRGPFLGSHFHPECARYFNQEGRVQLFLTVAEILAWRPDLKAFTGDAWYYDPAVAEISPHMAYIRDFPLAHGARFFRGPVDAGGAALTSAKRRRLQAAGEYEPRRYTMVWTRRSLLAWAARYEG